MKLKQLYSDRDVEKQVAVTLLQAFSVQAGLLERQLDFVQEPPEGESLGVELETEIFKWKLFNEFGNVARNTYLASDSQEIYQEDRVAICAVSERSKCMAEYSSYLGWLASIQRSHEHHSKSVPKFRAIYGAAFSSVCDVVVKKMDDLEGLLGDEFGQDLEEGVDYTLV